LKNKNNLAFVFTLSLAGIMGAYLYSKYRIAPELETAKIQLIDNIGNRIYLNELPDKNTIVIFFASWCGPCIKETPLLEAMKKALGTDDFNYIAISDEPLDKIDYFRLRTRSSFSFYKLNGKLSDIGIHTIPTAYILNRNGELVFKHVGDYSWDKPESIEKIRTLTAN
jgi:thiol-disulfide isomerase/thioredoxin